MDSFERVSDGLALQQIRREPGFFALERLLRQMKDDLFLKWASDEGVSKDYCKGSLEIIETLVPSIDQLIEWAVEERKHEREVAAVTRGTAVDGHGTGDLAL